MKSIVSLDTMYINLINAWTGFKDLGIKMLEYYVRRNIEVIEIKGYDYSVETKNIKTNINAVKKYGVDNGYDGILEPAETTIDRLDGYLEITDIGVHWCNLNMINIYDFILKKGLSFDDLKEYKKFYIKVYLDLCEAVRNFYSNVITTIGKKADYNISKDFVVDYFKEKGLNHNDSTSRIIPKTVNMFGEPLHFKDAEGNTITGHRKIDKSTFENEIEKRLILNLGARRQK